MLKIRGALFLLGFYVSTIVFSTPCILFGWILPYRKRYALFSAVTYFYIFWLRITCNLKSTVVGRENIPRDRPYVALASHSSEWETLYLQQIFRPQAIVLKKELLKVPFFGWALRLLKPIAIDRSKRKEAMQQLQQQGSERLKDGIPVLIFPQGTRVPLGQIGRITQGGTLLAVNSGVPIVPAVHDAARFWPGKAFIKQPGTITLVIGKPIETVGKTVEEVHQELQRWMIAQLNELGVVDLAALSDKEKRLFSQE